MCLAVKGGDGGGLSAFRWVVAPSSPLRSHEGGWRFDFVFEGSVY